MEKTFTPAYLETATHNIECAIYDLNQEIKAKQAQVLGGQEIVGKTVPELKESNVQFNGCL